MTLCWCWKVLVVFSGCNIFNDYKQNTLFSYQKQLYFNSGRVWEEVTGGTYSPPPPEMTCGVLIQLVTNYSMRFIGVEIKHDHMRQGWRIYVKNHKNVFLGMSCHQSVTSFVSGAPRHKKNPGSSLSPVCFTENKGKHFTYTCVHLIQGVCF